MSAHVHRIWKYGGLSAFVLAILASAGRPAEAKKANTDLMNLTAFSDAICTAQVRSVQAVEGERLAEAVVVRPLKGLRKGQRIWYFASPSWTCDTSTATPGETVMLFLDGDPSSRSSKRRELARRQSQKGRSLYEITHSGSGRLPLVMGGGEHYVEAGPASWRPTLTSTEDDVILPKSLPVLSVRLSPQKELRGVRAADIEQEVLKILRERK